LFKSFQLSGRVPEDNFYRRLNHTHYSTTDPDAYSPTVSSIGATVKMFFII
jgi:hypothetical protein